MPKRSVSHSRDILRRAPMVLMLGPGSLAAGLGPRPPSLALGGGGVTAELAGFVRGGGDDPARAVVPDQDRQPGEGGIVEDFDRSEEGVHIDVEDGAVGGGHGGIVAWVVSRRRAPACGAVRAAMSCLGRGKMLRELCFGGGGGGKGWLGVGLGSGWG